MAFIAMGGDPREFWDLTMDETLAYCEAYSERENNEWTRTAWIVMYIGAFAGAKPKMTVDKLLGRKPKRKDDKKIAEEAESFMSKLQIESGDKGPTGGAERVNWVRQKMKERQAAIAAKEKAEAEKKKRAK